MARPKGSKNKSTKIEKKVDITNFGNDLPKIVEIKSNELDKVCGYKHQLKGRFWRDKEEIVCVLLLEKYK